MPVLELVVIAQRQGARTDQAHLASQDVEKLRNLIERQTPEQCSHRGHPRVAAHLEERSARLVLPLEERLVLGRVRVHRPELEHVELVLA